MDIYENVHFTVVGGTKNEHSELLNRHKDLDLKLNLIENTNQENVSKYMKEFDIGMFHILKMSIFHSMHLH